MAARVRLGSLYRVTDISVFEWLDGFQPGDIVQVVNPPGGRTSGYLRHVKLMDGSGYIGFMNIECLEPHRP